MLPNVFSSSDPPLALPLIKKKKKNILIQFCITRVFTIWINHGSKIKRGGNSTLSRSADVGGVRRLSSLKMPLGCWSSGAMPVSHSRVPFHACFCIAGLTPDVVTVVTVSGNLSAAPRLARVFRYRNLDTNTLNHPQNRPIQGFQMIFSKYRIETICLFSLII